MSWQPLKSFRDPTVPKLDNLRRAVAAGLRVPATVWAPAAHLERAAPPGPPAELGTGPCILRSASPTEDTRETSNAGQLLSLPVRAAGDFAAALRRVVEALPIDGFGRRRGFVFVQPLVSAEEAGVVFFDAFYFERTVARGLNEGLTSGQERGTVQRGHRARADAWSDFLDAIYAVFGQGAHGDPRLDAEFARDTKGYILLQVRPALFPITRNPTLSLANHKEVLGDLPSPWLVSALVEAGRDLTFPAQADSAILQWDEVYAVEVAERAWLNVSFWFRWMDHFGLPRTMVTEGVGGHVDKPADGRMHWRRFAAAVPRLLWFQWCCLRTLPGLEREFQRYDRVLDGAVGLTELCHATAEGMKLALRANFAITAVLSGVSRIRRFLRLPGAAQVVTQDMMDAYRQLTCLPAGEREAGLDRWLEKFGHRGPLESDLARPRFRELRDVLLQDLMSAIPAPGGSTPDTAAPPPRPPAWLRAFFWVDERREWFRDEMMRRWERLRVKVLAASQRLVAEGRLDAPEDVFWLRPAELADKESLRAAVARARERRETIGPIALPASAPRDELESLLSRAAVAQAVSAGRMVFPGIALNPAIVEGRAVKADDLVSLLQRETQHKVLGPNTILVVPTLEPSWAVIFPRVGGVVAELGGELSHASILLREARRPAVVNCAGIFRQVRDGDQLRLDGARGLVERL